MPGGGQRSSAWRLLLDGEAPGPWNMGVDEALLASVARGGGPTLRFYAWEGPWLSLGYAQRPDADRLAACARAGVGVVRRVTGGRAVLHGGDLTYALAAPRALLPPGLSASYELVAGALVAALGALGVEVDSGAARRGPAGSVFDCFAHAAADALCSGGRKLAGSAQRRAGGGVLQHGSIRLFPDSPAARAAASLEGGAATSLRELGVDLSRERLQEACVDAFAAALGARFEVGKLEPPERSWAAERLRCHPRDPIHVPHPVPWGFSRVPLDGR